MLLAGMAQNPALGVFHTHSSQWTDGLRPQTPFCALVNWGLANLHTGSRQRKAQAKMETGSFWDKLR